MPWFWTDDLARLLTGSGQAATPVLDRWLRRPEAVRREGEAAEVARRLLEEESEDPQLAA
jgi:hypothetical protein